MVGFLTDLTGKVEAGRKGLEILVVVAKWRANGIVGVCACAWGSISASVEEWGSYKQWCGGRLVRDARSFLFKRVS